MKRELFVEAIREAKTVKELSEKFDALLSTKDDLDENTELTGSVYEGLPDHVVDYLESTAENISSLGEEITSSISRLFSSFSSNKEETETPPKKEKDTSDWFTSDEEEITITVEPEKEVEEEDEQEEEDKSSRKVINATISIKKRRNSTELD